MSHQHDHHHDDQDDPRIRLTAEFWDERYGASERHWSGNPNPRIVEQVADLAPGRALEVACGEGADAIWLAGRGWQVTATDVSTVALEKTAAHAIDAGVAEHLRTEQYDALTGQPPLRTAGYDLVTVAFLHTPAPDFAQVYRPIAAAVAPGGRLLVVAHHPADHDAGVPRPHGSGRLFGPERVLDALGAPGAEWEVEVADTPTREQEWEGERLTVTDTVVRLRRL